MDAKEQAPEGTLADTETGTCTSLILEPIIRIKDDFLKISLES